MARKKKNKEEKVTLEGLGKLYSSGKIEDKEKIVEQTRKLENLLGIRHVNPFGTNDETIFEQNLKEMSIADLQNLCGKVGLFPSYDKETVKMKLRKEFKRRTKGQSSIIIEQEMDIMHPDHPDHEKIKKLLS